MEAEQEPQALPQSPDDEQPSEPETALGAFTYTNRQGELVELSDLDQEWVVQRVTKTFDRLDSKKAKTIKRWEKTERAIKGVVSDKISDRFNGLVPYGKQSYQTLISHFWGRSLQTEKVLFNVTGQDDQAKKWAPLQKQNLLRIFRKDRLAQKMDDGIGEALKKGVVIGYVGYETRKQDFASPVEHAGIAQGSRDMTTPDNGAGMAEFEETAYDAASLKIIDPYDFVFDTDNHQKWDQCFKASRCFEVYEDIEENPNYSNFEELYELVSEKQGSNSTNLFSSKSKKAQKTGVDANGNLELIEFHGDFRLKDGSYLRNWTITVCARKKVIRFDKNPIYINPFTKWTYENTEDGWGISPIDYIIPLIDGGSMLMNTGIEAAKFNINPGWLAPKGMMPQKQFYLQEGMVVEYSPNMTQPNQLPTQIKLDAEAPFAYMQMLEGQSESTTGATRQLSGNVTSNDNSQTATEFSGLQVVGNLILDRVVDLFNWDFKIPIIEKHAKITAMFNPEAVTVQVEDEQGQQDFQKVQPEVYYGNYSYIIEDNKSELERKQNLQTEIAFLAQLAQDPDVGPRMKKVDMAQEVFRDMGYGNPAKMFMNDVDFIANKLKDTAIAEFIGQLVQQMPLGQMMMANGGVLDPQMMAQMAMQVQAQAQGVVGNALPQGQPGQPGQAQAPIRAAGNPAMASQQPGMGQVPGIPQNPGSQLPLAG